MGLEVFAMKISDIIDTVDELRPNNRYSDTQKIKWVSLLDQKIRAEVVKNYGIETISRVQDQSAYTIPEGVTFDNIVKVFFDGHEVPKIDPTSFEKSGYWLNADGEFAIYPTPAASDSTAGIRIIHLIIPAAYTEDTETVFAPDPYAEMYQWYIFAQMDLFDRNYDDYNNSITMFNSKFDEYAKFYRRTAPINNVTSRNYM